jgi:guanine deaminase
MPTWRARVLTPVSPELVAYDDDAVVVITDGRITAVGRYDGRPVDEDLRPGVLLPGFVDAHVHFPQTRIVGSASGPLLDWLDRSTFPEEARFADRGHAERIGEIFARNLAAAGTTLPFVYGPVFPHATDALLETFARTGQKAIAGPVLMDAHCPPELQLAAGPALDALDALADRWSDRFRIAAIPRFALSCSMELMRGAAALAARRGLAVSTHLSENPVECRIACERFGTADYLAVYEDAGLVVPGAVFAHCIHHSDAERDRFAAAGAVVAHCPDSNAFLGSGGMGTAAWRDRGVRIAIGTDVAAGRSFRIPRILSAAYDNALAQGLTLSAEQLLWWGTRGGALALGADDTGLVAPGLDADLVLVDVPEWATTARDVLAAMLFDHDAPRPRRTWVRGRQVWDRDVADAFPWWPTRAVG